MRFRDEKDLDIYVCGHLIVDYIKNREEKLIVVRISIRKIIRTKTKQRLWWIREKKVGNGCKTAGKKGTKLKKKETLMTADDYITGYNFVRIV